MSKVLGSLHEHTYEGKPYNFVVTRNARLAVEDMQFDIFDETGDTSAFTIFMELKTSESELKKAQDAGDEIKTKELEGKIEKITAEMLPNIKNFSKMQSKANDEYEIAKILLMNSQATNGEVTGVLADAVLEHMEATIGGVAYIEKLLEIYDNVFTQIAMIRDRKQAIDEKAKHQNDKALPMS